MEFLAEDMGRVAMMCVTESGVKFKGVTPKQIGNIDIATLANAKVVVSRELTAESLDVTEAIKDAWVLVVEGEMSEELVKIAHPYVTILKVEPQDMRIKSVCEEYSRGWNVENEAGEFIRMNVIVVNSNNMVEILFGESRENPIGLLSIKCLKK